MAGRPYVLLSAAMSADGHIDDASDRRLVLSDAVDLDRVDEVRAGCDAILVGAETIRRDNPRLRIRSADRERERVARGSAAARPGSRSPAAAGWTRRPGSSPMTGSPGWSTRRTAPRPGPGPSWAPQRR